MQPASEKAEVPHLRKWLGRIGSALLFGLLGAAAGVLVPLIVLGFLYLQGQGGSSGSSSSGGSRGRGDWIIAVVAIVMCAVVLGCYFLGGVLGVVIGGAGVGGVCGVLFGLGRQLGKEKEARRMRENWARRP